jgi:hypothetical protein
VSPIWQEFDESCHYSNHGVKDHTMFKVSSYVDKEINIYRVNKLIDTIIDSVINYDENDLTLNNYKLMFRAFPKWTMFCQEYYKTEYFQ